MIKKPLWILLSPNGKQVLAACEAPDSKAAGRKFLKSGYKKGKVQRL